MRYGIDPQRGHTVTSLWVNVQRAQWSMLEGSEINTPNKVQWNMKLSWYLEVSLTNLTFHSIRFLTSAGQWPPWPCGSVMTGSACKPWSTSTTDNSRTTYACDICWSYTANTAALTETCPWLHWDTLVGVRNPLCVQIPTISFPYLASQYRAPGQNLALW